MLDKEVIQWEDNIFILKEVLNARQVQLSTNSTDIEYKEKEGRITYINIADRLEAARGTTMEITINKTTHTYNIQTIQKLSSNSFIISTNITTKTQYFLLPMLGYNKEYFCTDTYLENVHITKDLTFLCLTYRYIKGEVYNKLESFLQNHKLFHKLIDIDSQHVMYIFKIPIVQTSNVALFFAGKYSEFTEPYKKNILTFYGYKQGGTAYKILYKSEIRRKQLELELGVYIPETMDLYDIPDIEDEVIEI